MIFRDILSVLTSQPKAYPSMEYVECLVKADSRLICLSQFCHRPPPKSGSPNTVQFLEEFDDLLEHLTLSLGNPLVVSDLNIYLDNTSNPTTRQFLGLLAATNHTKHVFQATHEKGHILDTVITRSDDIRVLDMAYGDSMSSDHSATIFSLPMSAGRPQWKKVTLRKWRHINLIDFCNDLGASPLLEDQATRSAKGVLEIYDATLSRLLE